MPSEKEAVDPGWKWNQNPGTGKVEVDLSHYDRWHENDWSQGALKDHEGSS